MAITIIKKKPIIQPPKKQITGSGSTLPKPGGTSNPPITRTPLVVNKTIVTNQQPTDTAKNIDQTAPIGGGGGGGIGSGGEAETPQTDTSTTQTTAPNPSDKTRMWLLVLASAMALGGIGYFVAKGQGWSMPLTIGGGVVVGAGVGYGISLMLPPVPVKNQDTKTGERKSNMSDNEPMDIVIVE